MKRLYFLVDDDLEDAGFFSDALNDLGNPVDLRHFESGDALIEYLLGDEAQCPDLLFLDLNMPGINGWQVLHYLKNHTIFKNIPVIIYSTSSINGDKSLAHRMGAAGFLSKPGSYNELVNMIDKIIRSPVSPTS